KARVFVTPADRGNGSARTTQAIACIEGESRRLIVGIGTREAGFPRTEPSLAPVRLAGNQDISGTIVESLEGKQPIVVGVATIEMADELVGIIRHRLTKR